MASRHQGNGVRCAVPKTLPELQYAFCWKGSRARINRTNFGSGDRVWMEYNVGSWRHRLIWQEVKSIGWMGSDHWGYVLEWDGGYGDERKSSNDGYKVIWIHDIDKAK
jgi:hypothetical protein